MSRSIGDMDSKKYGVIYDPEIFRYELKQNDKVVVVGTDGLWEQLTNEEVIEIVNECLNKDLKAKETAEIIIGRARKNFKDENENESNFTKRSKNDSYEGNYFLKSKREKKENKHKKITHIDDITCFVIFLDIKL